MSDEVEVAALGLQLVVVAGFVLMMVLIHSAGLVGISRALRLHDERSIPNEFGARASILMGTYGLLLMSLHFAEIFVFAAFYRAANAISLARGLDRRGEELVVRRVTPPTLPDESASTWKGAPFT